MTARKPKQPPDGAALENSAGQPRLPQALASLAQSVERTQRTLSASDNAAATIFEYGDVFGRQNLSMLNQTLAASMQAVAAGDLTECDKMLFGQASALQAIFTNLALQASVQTNTGHYEMYLRLAFKAQSQCRATLETLAAIKNPPNVAFVKQANIGQAVQVNNTPRAREIESRPNKLLGSDYGNGLDAGTAKAPVRAHRSRKTVEVINRAKNRSR